MLDNNKNYNNVEVGVGIIMTIIILLEEAAALSTYACLFCNNASSGRKIQTEIHLLNRF